MNRTTDNRDQDGELPSFLDTPVANSDNAESQSTEEQLGEVFDENVDEDYDDEDVDFEEGFEEGDFDDDEESFEDDTEDEDADAEPEQATAAASRRQTRTRRPHRQATPTAGGFTIAIGLLATIAATVAMTVPAVASMIANLAVEPQIILLLGIAVLFAGIGQRRTSRVQQRLDELEEENQQRGEALNDALQQLVQKQQALPSDLGDGNDLQHALLALQRQDEKINNLTKATKMYGKPLMEIARQGTELAGNIGQLKAIVEQHAQSSDQGFERIEEHLSHPTTSSTDLGPLPEQINKLEVSVAAITQRLDNSEVRKSLVRLEDTSKQLQQELTDLQRGDNVQKATKTLQDKLDEAVSGLNDGLTKMRDGNLGALDSTVRDIQREVSGLATGLATIQAAVKGGATARPAPAPAAATAAPAPATKAPSAPASKPSASGGGKSAESGGYATGQRRASGKNVLGAIAKLKQMKG